MKSFQVKEFDTGKRAQTDMERVCCKRNFRYCKYRVEQWTAVVDVNMDAQKNFRKLPFIENPIRK
jgi:hypothetical protein